MPTFADMKAKAASGVERMQTVKDRNTSVPLKKTNWDPYSGQPPPPPPPPRTLINENTKPKPTFLPPPSRTGSSVSSAASLSASSSRGGSETSPPPIAPRLPSRSPSVLSQTTPPPPPPTRPSFSSSASAPAPAPIPLRTKPSAPPPPPTRSSVSQPSSTPPPPPPPSRPAAHTRPGISGIATAFQNRHRGGPEEKIDWANLSEEDKAVFFAWLDEFFEGFQARADPAITVPSAQPPPPVKSATKPTSIRGSNGNFKALAQESSHQGFPGSRVGNTRSVPDPDLAGPWGDKPSRHADGFATDRTSRSSEPATPSTTGLAAMSNRAPGAMVTTPALRLSSANATTTRTSRSLGDENDETTALGDLDTATWTPLSHPPPPTIPGSLSSAHDMAHYFSPRPRHSTWDRDLDSGGGGDPWYNAGEGQSSIPPPLRSRTDVAFSYSWRAQGTDKATNLGVLFGDLSVFWGVVEFSTRDARRNVKRKGTFMDRPRAFGDQRDLVEWGSEVYGECVAGFAESFLAEGGEEARYCGRGECWDLANEAIKYCAGFDYIPKPLPSIGRTHGHLIWEGKVEAGGGGRAVGRWRGGDDRIRRGDIIEWRKARVGFSGGSGRMRTRGHYTLGDPDHTAVITRDTAPLSIPTATLDGTEEYGALNPAQLGTIEVVEQSVSTGMLPKRQEYDLKMLEEGEVWIYRVVGMKRYLGVNEVVAVPPEGLGDHGGLAGSVDDDGARRVTVKRVEDVS